MANDDTAVGLAIPYFILIVITWITLGSRSFTYPYSPWLFTIAGAWIIFYGALFFIPVFILTIIFLATGDDGCEKVAFGLALPGFLLIIIGDVIALSYTIDNYLTPALVLAFVLPQVILAFGLFARRNYSLRNFGGSSPMARRRVPPIVRQGQIYGTPRSQIPRGRVQIPNEVQMAGTYGQSIKKCIRCGQTLDERTRVCYFCGARQPSQTPPRRPAPTPSPVAYPSLYSRVQSPAPRDAPKFCPNCGASTSRGHLFCTQCGSSLE